MRHRIKVEFVPAALWLFTMAVLGQSSAQAPALNLNEPQERELKTGQAHEYQVSLRAGEFMQVRVEQLGVDVVLSIHSDGGEPPAEMDSLNGKLGFETLSLIAKEAGPRVVRVRTLDRTSNAAGRYTVALLAKRAATAQDLKRVEAEREFLAVNRTVPRTPSQLNALIKKIEALLPVWRELKDDYVVGLLEEFLTEARETASELEAHRRREESKAGAKAEHLIRKNAIEERRRERERANANSPQLTIGTGHSASVNAIAFSPDGKVLVSGGDDRTVKLWDVETGQELRTLKGNLLRVETVAVSPDGRTVASAGKDIHVKLLDLVSGRELHNLAGHTGMDVWSVAFSPDGRTLASGGGAKDRTVRLWDVASGQELKALRGHELAVKSVAFSPDGRLVASGSIDRTIRLWDVASGQELRTLRGYIEFVNSVAFSPDGRTLASGGDNTAKLWDVASGRELRAYDGHAGGVISVAFMSDGKTLVTGSFDGTVKVWDVATGRELRTLEGHTKSVQSVAVSPRGRVIASRSDDRTVRLWDVSSGKVLRTFTKFISEVRQAVFSPDGRLLASSSWDGPVRLWDMVAGRNLHTLGGGGANSLAFSADGRVLAAGGDEATKLWDVLTGKKLQTFKAKRYRFRTAAGLSPDGRVLASGEADGPITLWDAAAGTELHTLKGHEEEVESLAFSTDGKVLASAARGIKEHSVRLWDVAAGRELRRLSWRISTPESLAFSPDGKILASGHSDDTIRLSEVETGREVGILVGHLSTVKALAFSAGGNTLTSADKEGSIIQWDVPARREIKVPRPAAESMTIPGRVVVAANGQVIRADIEGNKIVLRDVMTEDAVATLIALDGKEPELSGEEAPVPQAAQDWAVVDADGRWDASDGAQRLMNYVLHTPEGFEVIEFAQLKERYYEPYLLPKLLGYNSESLKDVARFRNVLLPPAVEPVEPADAASTVRRVRIRNRKGGIGRVQVFVNGREFIEDARDERLKAAPHLAEYVLSFDLKGAPVIAGREADVRVLAWNYDENARERYRGYISSRGAELIYLPPEEKAPPTTLYAIIGGVSDYRGDALDLRFAAKDAEDIYRAVKVGGKNLFGAERTRVRLLSTGGSKDALPPTKENFRQAFADFAAEAKPNDILLVYLAGHGITLNTGSDTYYYLTQQATTNDKQTLGRDSELLSSTTINSEELTQWHKNVKALKQVLILDTCAAGAVTQGFNILEKRELSSDAKRAIERMRTRVGFHVLMGSAADAVSYEASQYGQGLLTYSLLQGMKGAALQEDGQVDVSRLFNYAADTVPSLARHIGGIQRPEIKVPSGGASFAIGIIQSDDDKRSIPLASVKPVVLGPKFQNRERGYDDLKIEDLLRARLREAADTGLVFVDAQGIPGAISPEGNYVVEGKLVRVMVNLLLNGQPAATFTVEGSRDDLPALSGKIVKAVGTASARLGEPAPAPESAPGPRPRPKGRRP